MSSESEDETKENKHMMADVCADLDIFNHVIDPDLLDWEVMLLRTVFGQKIVALMALNYDSLSKNYLVQLPVIMDIANQKALLYKYTDLTSDLFYYIPKAEISTVMFASSEACKLYETGVKTYYSEVDINPDAVAPLTESKDSGDATLAEMMKQLASEQKS